MTPEDFYNKPRTKHRIVITFDIEVAPEVAQKVKDSIGRSVYSMLDYPMDALGALVYSFERPNPPDEVTVTIEEIK